MNFKITLDLAVSGVGVVVVVVVCVLFQASLKGLVSDIFRNRMLSSFHHLICCQWNQLLSLSELDVRVCGCCFVRALFFQLKLLLQACG